MSNVKTVPNQKKVKVSKEACNKQNLYATINLAAMEAAAQKLDAGAFKLWIYFAKNQNDYEFALSSSEVERVFGIKIKQYNNAIKELKEKGYLVEISGNCYKFCESAVITKEDNTKNSVMPKGNNAVMTKSNNAVMPKSNNALLPKDIRNNTDITYNTIDTTKELPKQPQAAVIANSSTEPRKVKLETLENMGVRYELVGADKVRVLDTGKLFKISRE